MWFEKVETKRLRISTIKKLNKSNSRLRGA